MATTTTKRYNLKKKMRHVETKLTQNMNIAQLSANTNQRRALFLDTAKMGTASALVDHGFVAKNLMVPNFDAREVSGMRERVPGIDAFCGEWCLALEEAVRRGCKFDVVYFDTCCHAEKAREGIVRLFKLGLFSEKAVLAFTTCGRGGAARHETDDKWPAFDNLCQEVNILAAAHKFRISRDRKEMYANGAPMAHYCCLLTATAAGVDGSVEDEICPGLEKENVPSSKGESKGEKKKMGHIVKADDKGGKESFKLKDVVLCEFGEEWWPAILTTKATKTGQGKGRISYFGSKATYDFALLNRLKPFKDRSQLQSRQSFDPTHREAMSLAIAHCEKLGIAH
jgi:hypothetical protein